MKSTKKLKTTIKSIGSLLFVVGSSLFFFSCSLNSTSDFPEGNGNLLIPATEQGFKALRAETIDQLTQTFELDIVDNTIEFTSAQGVEVFIYTDCLTFESESAEDGDTIEAHFIELYKREDLLTTNIATMGIDENGDPQMLVTGGAFYLNLYKNGVPVDNDKYCGFKMIVPSSNTGEIDYDMILWYGAIDDNGDLFWEDAGEQEVGSGEVWFTEGEELYYAWSANFGWTNIDRFYDVDGDNAELAVEVPEGYNKENSAAYVIVDGEEYGLAQLYRDDNEQFSSSLLSVGLDVHIVFVTESNGEWAYAAQSTKVEENKVIRFENEDLKTATLEELVEYLNTLP